MVDGSWCCWVGRRWWWGRHGGLLLLLLLFSRLMVTAGGGGGAAGTATGVAGSTTGIVTAVITAAAGGVDATVTTTATTLSLSAVALSLPVAMHLSRYGRLPSWNKSRAQCLVIFHSSTMKEIVATAIIFVILSCYILFLKIQYSIVLENLVT